MAPLVVGGSALIFQPYLEAAGDAFRSDAAPWVAEHLPAVLAICAVALVVARFSSAVRDVFALNPADHYLDALPISSLARAHAAMTLRIAKALPVALMAFVAIYLAAPPGSTMATVLADHAAALLGGSVALAVFETAIALVFVRLRWVHPALMATVSCAAAGIAVALDAYLVWVGAVAIPAAYALTIVGFSLWRIEDRDRAAEALARARKSSVAFERFADRWLGPRIGAQFVRDLRLVRRGFSSSPYLTAGLAILFPALAVWANRRFDLPIERRVQIVESAAVLSAFAMATVTHALVAYERPRIWIDLVSGVEKEAFPKAKLWLARALALPSFVLACVAAPVAGVPLDPISIFKLAWLVWTSASLTAVMCYELKERPATGIILAFIIAAGDALLLVFTPSDSIMRAFSVFLYFYASWNLLQRAKDKVA